jgi:hypothetical protein
MTEALGIFLMGSIGVLIGMAALYLAIKCLVIVVDRLPKKENADVSS